MVIHLAARQSCGLEFRRSAGVLAALIACGLATGCGGGASKPVPAASTPASSAPASGAPTMPGMSGMPGMPGMPGMSGSGAAPAAAHGTPDPTAMMVASAQGASTTPMTTPMMTTPMTTTPGAHGASGGTNPPATTAATSGAIPNAGGYTAGNPGLAGGATPMPTPNTGHAAGGTVPPGSVGTTPTPGAGQYTQPPTGAPANAGTGTPMPGMTPMQTTPMQTTPMQIPMQTPMPGAQAGAIPGGPMPGGAIPGGPMGAGGGGAPQPPSADSAEFPAFKLVVAVIADDWDSLGDFISVKATGPLKELRTKTMSEPRKDELKKEFAQVQPLSAKTVSGGKQFTFKSGTTIITMIVKKENGAFRVSEMTRRTGK